MEKSYKKEITVSGESYYMNYSDSSEKAFTYIFYEWVCDSFRKQRKEYSTGIEYYYFDLPFMNRELFITISAELDQIIYFRSAKHWEFCSFRLIGSTQWGPDTNRFYFLINKHFEYVLQNCNKLWRDISPEELGYWLIRASKELDL